MPPDNRRYELMFKLAAGGMAEVFAARYLAEAGFERIVAIKRMHPHLAGDASFTERFLEEARLSARIASPHVVHTVDVGLDAEGIPFLVMELVRGAPLSQLLATAREAGTPLPLPVVVDLTTQIAKGLVAIHGARTLSGEPMGLVHRDVSPQNLLVDADGHCRVSDFGIAKSMATAAGAATTGLEGKLAYMSPEQVRLEPLDPRSDLFSLGIVVWEMLTGARLFGARGGDVLANVCEQPIPEVRSYRDDVPDTLSTLVSSMLERSVTHRLPSAEELLLRIGAVARELSLTGAQDQTASCVRTLVGSRIEELERRLEGALAEGARGAVTLENTLAAPPDAEPATRSVPPPRSDREAGPRGAARRPGRVSIAVAVVAAAVAAVAGGWMLGDRAPAEPVEARAAGAAPMEAPPVTAPPPAPELATVTESPALEPDAGARIEPAGPRSAHRRRSRRRSRAREPRAPAPAGAVAMAPRAVPDHALLTLDELDRDSRSAGQR